MYIPSYYQMPDAAQQAAFLRQYPFATLVSAADNLPSATHLPFVLQTNDDGTWQLFSHLAKANPQAAQLSQSPVLVIFQEPHAYISPRFYDKKMNVPTWNYVAVHVYGNISILHGNDAWDVLHQMILTFEEQYQQQWNELPESYKRGLFDNIVAFRLDVTEVQAKKKLSQNKTAAEQERIFQSLSQSPNSSESDLERWR